MRSALIISGLMLLVLSAKSQKWQPGYFYDVKGTKNPGLIRLDPPGRGPIKDEGFIEYKEDAKAGSIRLSASDLRSFVVGKDSFIAAIEPREGWAKNEMDFVRVDVDAPLRLFEAKGNSGGGGASGGPGFGLGIGGGTGGYGGGFGGGVSIPIAIGGGKGSSKVLYFYGANTAEMKLVTDQNFVDVMSEVMGDEPDVVDKIQQKKYSLRTMDKLIAYFKVLMTKSGSQ